MNLKKGTLLQGGKYRIDGVLGRGGFGVTYLAYHTELECEVAIKEFFIGDFCNRESDGKTVTVATQGKKDLVEKLRMKFKNEARSIEKLQKKLHHSGIVNVSDLFDENGTSYYVMEYVEGRSLGKIMIPGVALSEESALGYIRKLCDALALIHANNIMHLDIKPDNIMIDDDGRVVLIDFGASKQYDEVSGENTSTLLGYTRGYAPPEQMNQNVSKFLPATDIYALGATFYKLLTGNAPIEANLRASGEKLSSLPSSVSQPVRRAIEAAMQLDKLNRPQSVKDFLALLDAKSSAVKGNGEDTARVAEVDESTVFTNGAPVLAETANENPNISMPDPVPQPPKKTSLKKWVLSFVFSVLGILALVLPIRHCSDAADKAALEQLRLDSIARVDSIAKADSIAIANAIADSIAKAVVTYKVQTYSGDVEFKMIEVKGGTFRMGATKDMDSDAYSDESPVHDVTLSDYYIGETEVTQELWETVMGSNPSYYKGDLQRPVERVSRNDCQTFIGKLNELTGGNFRLPTEAEWEYAARGGNKSRGYKYSGSDKLSDVAWYESNSNNTTHAVKTKSPNELGIYDMSGNVSEWCEDWYDKDYYSSSPQANPKGPSSGSYRVDRGGNRSSNVAYCRCAHRSCSTSSVTSGGLGLRLVSQ